MKIVEGVELVLDLLAGCVWDWFRTGYANRLGCVS